jgi:hypothetical protein
MKLDKDAVRAVLLAVEANNGTPRGWIDIEIPGFTEVQVSYHVELLSEAGFLEVQDLSHIGSYEWKPKRLTFAGHEYLDTVRDNEIWRLTKEGAKEVGASSVSMLFEIGKAIVKQKAIEHGIHI